MHRTMCVTSSNQIHTFWRIPSSPWPRRVSPFACSGNSSDSDGATGLLAATSFISFVFAVLLVGTGPEYLEPKGRITL